MRAVMNFIDAFKAWMGKTECPEPYMRYSALSLLAAACGNRIYLEVQYGNRIFRLHPNLYTILVGPTGSGKSAAMKAAIEILDGVDALARERGTCEAHYETGLDMKCTQCQPPMMRYNRFDSGRLTNAGLYDLMRTTRRIRQPDGSLRKVEVPAFAQAYIIMDELRHGLGHPQHVDQLIAALTQMAYDDRLSEMTRTHGRTDINNLSVNLLAGTTLDWMIQALDRTMLTAGTFGRLITVVCDYSPLRHPADCIIDPNAEAYKQFLVARVSELLDINAGAFKLSEEAMKVDKAWYYSQDLPNDSTSTVAVHSRKHLIALKIATLLKLADERDWGTRPHEIDSDHLVIAQQYAEEILRWQDEIAPAILRGETHSADTHLLNKLQAAGVSGMQHSTLLRIAMSRFGWDTERLGKLVRTWEEAHEIRVDAQPRSKGGTRYYYTGKEK